MVRIEVRLKGTINNPNILLPRNPLLPLLLRHVASALNPLLSW